MNLFRKYLRTLGVLSLRDIKHALPSITLYAYLNHLCSTRVRKKIIFEKLKSLRKFRDQNQLHRSSFS